MKRPDTTLGRLGGFLLSGLPSFLVALPLNIALVEGAGMPEPPAYAIVLVVQVTANFFMLRRFVFEPSDEPVPRQFARFLAGIGGFRVADWALYTVLVEAFGLWFVAAQILNVAVFSVAKFAYSARVIEGPSRAPR